MGYQYPGVKKLMALVGPAFTKEIFYTGRQFSAQDALAMGLLPLRSHTTFVPGRTSSCRGRTVKLLFEIVSGDRDRRAGLAAPAEIGPVRPHAVENYRQSTRDGDDGAPHAPALCDLHPPGLELRPMPALGQQHLRGFIQHRSQHGVAGLGDAPVIVDLARLMASRC